MSGLPLFPPGGPGGPAPVVATAEDLAAVQQLLDGAALLGLEVDTRYRVLAMTVEPVAAGATGDARLQLLLHPVGRMAASLREAVREDDGTVHGVVRTFAVEQLPDVVALLGGPPLAGPLFAGTEPTDAEWGPVRSLEGRAQVPDGHTHRLRIDVVGVDEPLAFGFFATFDAVEVRDAAGRDVPVDDD